MATAASDSETVSDAEMNDTSEEAQPPDDDRVGVQGVYRQRWVRADGACRQRGVGAEGAYRRRTVSTARAAQGGR